MKEALINAMVVMMPMMKPFMWFSVLVCLAGLFLIAAKYILKNDYSRGALWSARIVMIAAVFFLAAQLAGQLLSMPPTINFGDSSKFEFILVSFWQIGLGLLIASLFIRFVGVSNKAKTA